jgi:hypothetical protein
MVVEVGGYQWIFRQLRCESSDSFTMLGLSMIFEFLRAIGSKH